MDYTDSGFKAGFALDMDALLTAIRDNPEQFMPDPSRGGMPGCLGVREESVV